MKQADHVMVVVPYSPATHGLIGLLLLGSKLIRRHFGAARRITDQRFPSGQVFAVKEGGKSWRRRILAGPRGAQPIPTTEPRS